MLYGINAPRGTNNYFINNPNIVLMTKKRNFNNKEMRISKC